MEVNKKSGEMRYAYIKNGDVVTQLEHIIPLENNFTSSGPEAFIYDLSSKVVCGAPIMLLSQHNRDASFHSDNIVGKVYAQKASFLGKVVSGIMIFAQVYCRLISFKPDRILCGRPGPMFWACSAYSQLHSVPLVFSSHTRLISKSLKWYKRIDDKLNKWRMKNTLAVICHGPYLCKKMRDIGVHKSRIFEFDVGFKDMLEEVDKNPDPANHPVQGNYDNVLYMGRIEREKGIFDLLEACEKIMQANSKLRLIYIGTGSQLDTLMNDVEARGLKGRVLVLGRMPHETLGSTIKRSKIVVTPTQQTFPEGRCMVAMEALVIGIPVIAPDFGPFPFLVKHRVNGLLFEVGSVQKLRESIMEALNDEDLYSRMQAGARKSGQKLISPPLTYGQAVMSAFSNSSHHLNHNVAA